VYSGAMSGAGGLVLSSGSLELSGINTFTGGTTVNSGGTLVLDNGNTNGSVIDTLTINPGGTVICLVTNAIGYSGNHVTTAFINGGEMISAAGNTGQATSFNLTGGTLASTGGTYTFNLAGVNITSNSSSVLSLVSAPLSIQGNSLTFNVALGSVPSGVDLLVSGVVSGANPNEPIVKTGAGLMAFGAAPTYTGTTTISAGTLQIGNNNSVTSFASTATLDNATLAFKDTGALSYGFVISGSGGLVQNGSDVVTLSGTNTFSGNILINSGTLNASVPNTSSTAGPLGNLTTAGRTITVASGGVLELAAGNVTSQTNLATALNISGEVISTVGTNGNTLGPVTLTGGTLTGMGGWNGNSIQMFSLGNGAATGSINANGATNSYITSTAGATWTGLALAASTNFDVYGGGALIVSDSLANVFGGAGGAAALTKTGTGLLELTVVNVYTGGTTVSAGTLLVNPNNLNTGSSLLGSGSVAIGAGATLEAWTNSFGTAAVNLPPVAVNGGALISLGGAGQDSRLGALTMTGGTVSGNQFDPQSGVTTLGSTAEALISVNTLRLEASNTFNVTAGTVSGGPDLLVTSSITQDVGPYGITKSGNGLMVIAGSNTYTGGTRVAGGLLELGSASATLG
ncbi:MAG: autotransporter-associated beta strand repeat-containing protein, partial [Terriglobales bacterium]